MAYNTQEFEDGNGRNFDYYDQVIAGIHKYNKAYVN